MKSKFRYLIDQRSIRMFFLGFSAGLPLLLVFSTLSVWLTKADIERSTITLFSWVGFAFGIVGNKLIRLDITPCQNSI